MNPNDLNNVRFILALDPKGLRDWWTSVSEEDRQYASEIMGAYSELLTHSISLMTDDDLTEDDCFQAKQLLSKFMLTN